MKMQTTQLAVLLAAGIASAGAVSLRGDASANRATTDRSPYPYCNKLDCPLYNVTQEFSDTDAFNVRAFETYHWASVKFEVKDVKEGYWKAQSDGFNKLFKYISGANEGGVKIEMATPVLNKVEAGQGPACTSSITVSFFTPFANQDAPPTPTDPDVFIETIAPPEVAVYSFGGFLKGFDDVVTRSEELGEQADEHDVDIKTGQGDYYYVAEYDSPYQVFNRHNEIWYQVESQE